MTQTSGVVTRPQSRRCCQGANLAAQWPPAESNLTCPADIALRASLHNLVTSNPDFWDFGGTARRNFAHGYFQYPAMMVPNMVGHALDKVAAHRQDRIHLFDPFAGSGTVVTEAVARGWDVTAVDVNPLAAMLCQTKGGPFFPRATADATARVLVQVRQSNAPTNHWFPNVRKWFEPGVIDGLSSLHQAIQNIGSPPVRRFLWIALAETVRLTSNSRLSTVKLHIKPAEDRIPADVVKTFERIAERNLGLLAAEADALRKAGHIRRGWPTSKVRVILGDITTANLSGATKSPNVLVTSPPYGDNHSTITYGQHAFLPLQWICLPDTGAPDRSAVSGPSSIDSISLGGLRRNGYARSVGIRSKSEAARATLDQLTEIRPDHADKVGAFLSDLDLAFDSALQTLAPASHVVVTIGDRTVSGIHVPTARIVQDMVTHKGAVVIAAIPRRLPKARRMASRNNFASRIDSEWMLVMRLST